MMLYLKTQWASILIVMYISLKDSISKKPTTQAIGMKAQEHILLHPTGAKNIRLGKC